MKKSICFEANKIDELLPEYELKQFDIENEIHYYFCLNTVESVNISYGWLNTMHIYLKNGTKVNAEDDNTHIEGVNDTDIVRINNNIFVSPKLVCDGKFVKLTKKLEDWLLSRGVTESELKEIDKPLAFYKVENMRRPEWHIEERRECCYLSKVKQAKNDGRYIKVSISSEDIGRLLQDKHITLLFLNNDYEQKGMIDIELSDKGTSFDVSRELNELIMGI